MAEPGVVRYAVQPTSVGANSNSWLSLALPAPAVPPTPVVPIRFAADGAGARAGRQWYPGLERIQKDFGRGLWIAIRGNAREEVQKGMETMIADQETGVYASWTGWTAMPF